MKLFDRPDWLWIYRIGKEGSLPKGVPARYFEWSGHAIMRSDWGRDAQWAFFDLGPNGADHQHADRFHLSVSLGQQDILVDSGRYIYKPGSWRDYFKGPRSHNVLMIDGQGAQLPLDRVKSPLPVTAKIEESRTFFEAEQLFPGSIIKGTGGSKHRRAVAYEKDKYWIVRDTIETFGTHTAEVFWHFHPDCKVEVNGLFAYTTFKDRLNLAIAPILPDSWDVSLIRGQEEPHPQGWYSHQYNVKAAATVAVYKGYIDGPTTLYWVIMPVDNGALQIPDISALKNYIDEMDL